MNERIFLDLAEQRACDILRQRRASEAGTRSGRRPWALMLLGLIGL